jgi:hypothetical protein
VAVYGGPVRRLGVILALLVALGTAGYLDREHTRSVSSRASADSWWCRHRQIRCTGFDEAAYYRRWEWRERGYAAGALLLVSAAALTGARGLGLRP